MPAGFRATPVNSPASQGLLASRWKSRRLPHRSIFINGLDSGLLYPPIAGAMLKKAASEAHGSPPSKIDTTKMLFSSRTSPARNGNIEEQFKKAQQSSQSIVGFTNYTKTSELRTKPLKSKQGGSKTPTSSSAPKSAILSTGLHSVLVKQNSFHDSQHTTDLTEQDLLPNPRYNLVEFDENDFDNDADLDFDMEYELPDTSTIAPHKHAQNNGLYPSPNFLPKIKDQCPHSSGIPPSSAMTWSSSSLSHIVTPPGVAEKRQRGLATEQTEAEDPLEPVLPRKRRTLPWLQAQAELDQIAAAKEEQEEEVNKTEDMISSNFKSQTRCLRCRKSGHSSADCRIPRGKGEQICASLSKDGKHKVMPWNSTASAVMDEKKKFLNRQKAAKNAHEELVELHHRSKPKPAMAAISLSEEQRRVLDLVVDRAKSVFFTGSAGTGKSVLMRAIIADLRKKYSREPDRVAVTASTGLAACNIGGITLHSFGGIGLGKEDVPTLVKKIKRNPKAKNRWIRTKILIIDEVSMVDGELFDKLEGIARAIRNNGRPFGGIQLVITGDFFQLPPVPDRSNNSKGIQFAFDAGTWSTAIHHTIGLTQVFRQKDPLFANMLNEIRLGKITNETVAAFQKLSRKTSYEDGLQSTELFPTRYEVDNANSFRMRDLHGQSRIYEARDGGTIIDEVQRSKLLSNMMAPKILELKKGAQVMLIKNMDDGLVNGSIGKVRGFMDERTFNLYDADPEIFSAEEDIDEKTRARRDEMSAKLSTKNSSNEFPLVEFSGTDGISRSVLILPEEWKVELPTGEVQAQRQQLPLILAWALSIHKAQGQTLERVKIDLKKIFEKGQAYVALSRATSQAGLEVLNFDKNKVMAHPRVAQFYNSLYSVNKALEHPRVVAMPKESKSYDKMLIKSELPQVQENNFEDDTETIVSYC